MSRRELHFSISLSLSHSLSPSLSLSLPLPRPFSTHIIHTHTRTISLSLSLALFPCPSVSLSLVRLLLFLSVVPIVERIERERAVNRQKLERGSGRAGPASRRRDSIAGEWMSRMIAAELARNRAKYVYGVLTKDQRRPTTGGIIAASRGHAPPQQTPPDPSH